MASPWMNSLALVATTILGLATLGGAALGIAVWLNRGRSAAALWLVPVFGTSFAIGGSWTGAFIAQRMAGAESPLIFGAWAAGLVVASLIGSALGLGVAASIQLRAEPTPGREPAAQERASA